MTLDIGRIQSFTWNSNFQRWTSTIVMSNRSQPRQAEFLLSGIRSSFGKFLFLLYLFVIIVFTYLCQAKWCCRWFNSHHAWWWDRRPISTVVNIFRRFHAGSIVNVQCHSFSSNRIRFGKSRLVFYNLTVVACLWNYRLDSVVSLCHCYKRCHTRWWSLLHDQQSIGAGIRWQCRNIVFPSQHF